MCPITDQFTNDAFFELLRAREQALCPNPYISNQALQQRLHRLIGTEVQENLKAEKTNHGKPTERVTTVLDANTKTMKTELQEIER